MREADEVKRRFPRAGEETNSVTATVARKEFGRILDLVEQGREIIITRNGVATAVMMPVARFDVLTADDFDAAADSAMLDTLTAEFDALLERMQTPEARAAMERAFNASPEELGRAAAAAARRER